MLSFDDRPTDRLLRMGRSIAGGSDPPDPEPAPEPEEPEKPAVDPAQYVSRTDFDTMRDQLAQTNRLLEATMTRPQVIQQAPQVQGRLAPPTDDEIEAAIREGTGAAALLKRRDEALRAEMRGELDTIRSQGTELFASTAARWAERELPHFKRFKTEIMKELEKIPAQYRTSAESYESIHDMVVGRNSKVLIEEARQQAIREGVSADGTKPGGAHGRGKDTPKVPTVGEKFGDAAEAMLRGRDPDVFAKRMGYASWAAYVKDADEYEIGEIPVAGRPARVKAS